jgi:hypothetical protein
MEIEVVASSKYKIPMYAWSLLDTSRTTSNAPFALDGRSQWETRSYFDVTRFLLRYKKIDVHVLELVVKFIKYTFTEHTCPTEILVTITTL